MTDKNEPEKYTIEIGKRVKHKLDMLMGNLNREMDKYRDGGKTYDQIIDFLLDMLDEYGKNSDVGSDDDEIENEEWEKEWTKYD